ncbi:MAG TPA: hypothetical protein VHP33_09105 [Polyangiaceae bacterium]|nr:hypothetical protein [Polyangiaceae bacterium]
MKIPEEFLQLTLRQVLNLQIPRRRPGPASLSQLRLALRRMAQQIAANDAAVAAEQRAWLAEQVSKL